MRLAHFRAYAPVCPACRRAGAGLHRLALAHVLAGDDASVTAGILHCPGEACRHEYPIVDGLPIIVPDIRRLAADRGIELFLRDDLDPMLESLLGDALGPDSWLDALRQTQSTYGWDGWADCDPDEPDDEPKPGSARRCLAALTRLAGAASPRVALDLGCAAGRTSFDLAHAHPDASVLGLDTNIGLLRIARGALTGTISYPRRRVGLVYDRRRFSVAPAGADRVDFWACDALALPFTPAAADLIAALNLIDCLPDPAALPPVLAEMLRPGGIGLLATPYDWSTRATTPEAWIGGHSQRGPGGGAPYLAALLTGDHPRAARGLTLLGQAEAPWATRLHDRAAVSYRTHLLAVRRDG